MGRTSRSISIGVADVDPAAGAADASVAAEGAARSASGRARLWAAVRARTTAFGGHPAADLATEALAADLVTEAFLY